MIDLQYRGKAVSSIPKEAFACGFTVTDSYPTLVLASVSIVPDTTDEQWRLAYEHTSGHYCNTVYCAVRELSIRSEVLAAVRGIADDCFTHENISYFETLPTESRETARLDYLQTLTGFGLTCSPVNLNRLTQTLYPLDATPENLRKLSGDIIDLHVCPTGDLVLFITGPWI
ncbi:TPA: hypothetical protein ACNBIW_003810 [Escherichia coli]|nr:hypothetical protein [Escherichia coli]